MGFTFAPSKVAGEKHYSIMNNIVTTIAVPSPATKIRAD